MLSAKPCLVYLIIICSIFACQPEMGNDEVHISVEGAKGKVAKISKTNIINLSDSVIAEIEPDSAGFGEVKIILDKPLLANLKIGEHHYTVYLQPGYNFKIKLNEDSSETIGYTGRGSEANNYLAKAAQLSAEISNANDKNIHQLDVDSFLERLDSMKQVIQKFHMKYADSVPLSEKELAYLSRINERSILGIKQNYTWNYANQHNFDIPTSLKVDEEILLDSTLVELGSFQQAAMLQFFMFENFYTPVWNNKNPEEEVDETNAPLLAVKNIDEKDYSNYLDELLKSKNVDYWLATYGITPPVDSIYNSLKREYPNSGYLATIQKGYDEWIKISPGQPAPDFTGRTEGGEDLLLSDLKGKVVYIDVWATWCGPCVQEIPYSKELHQKFSERDDLVFLYVSVDSDTEAWKQKLSSDKEWKGIHINQNPDQTDSLTIGSLYKIWGIPRYILIDKEGKIVDNNAPRPSSGKEIEEKLAHLLSVISS